MILGFISVLATLVLLMALNWQSLRAMGWERVTRMLLIWLGIIAGLGVLLRLLGF
jgi:hypothetical protein